MPSLIMHDDLFRSAFAVVTLEQTIANFPFANLIDTSTSNSAGFAVGAVRVVTIDLGVAFPFDTLCIAKHNIGTRTGVIHIDRLALDDVAQNWINCFTLIPNNDNVIYHKDSTLFNARYIRVRVDEHNGDVFISNMQFGLSLEIDTGQGVGFVPPEMAISHEVTTNVTRGNELAGLVKREKPYAITFTIRHVDNTWFRTNWIRLARGLTTYPVYFLWQTGERAIYCWLRGELAKPAYSSLKHQSVEISVEGFV